MSVLKNKRSVSSLEFYHNAIMLRREITMLLLRDFGIKDKVRSVKSLYGVPGMEPEDEQKFREIVEKIVAKARLEKLCQDVADEKTAAYMHQMIEGVL